MKLFVGIDAPLAIAVTVTGGVAGGDFDLSTVSSGVLKVRIAGTIYSWSCSLSAQSATSVTLTHVFDGSELTARAIASIWPEMTTPSATLRGTRQREQVYQPWEV